jgi:hypothetical protein
MTIATGSGILQFLSLFAVAGQHAVIAQDVETSLRGGGINGGNTNQQQHRKLALEPGEFNCGPHPSMDGSSVCEFRTNVPDNAGTSANGEDVTYNTSTHLACINEPAAGYQYCVNVVADMIPNQAGLYGPVPGGGMMPDELPSAQQVEEPEAPQPEQPPPPPPQIVDTDILFPEYFGVCPVTEPPTGGYCVTAIPAGQEMIQCTYRGPFTCICSYLPGTMQSIGWECAFGQPQQQQQQQPPVSDPVPPVVTLPANPVPAPIQQITAEVNEAVITPAMFPTTAPRVGSIGLNVPPVMGCGTSKPADGSSCEWSHKGSSDAPQRCPYEDSNSPTGWVTCDCTKEEGVKCRTLG